tara:strand:+ start:670 stop:1770 length:1101 start_codon:yes stop_codon:yes gene_type:complete
MDFIDLKTSFSLLRKSIDARINSVFESGQYILGKQTLEMEQKLSEYVDVDHCIALSNGTDALLIALMSLGIGRDDEVITSPFSFIACAEMISLLGAKPVFIDINPLTYNLDENLLENSINNKTKAIIPISLFGQCSDLGKVNKIAKKYNIPVIEDAAQSFGATYKNKSSCGLTTIATTSFFPSKPLGCYGDGGAIFTNDSKLATRIRELRMHGESKRYHHDNIGVNGRMDELQAAIILSKLEIFNEEIRLRQNCADIYLKLINEHFTDEVITPYIESFNTSVFAQYTLMVPNRDHVHEELKKKGIPTGIYYPIPVHLQNAFAYLGYCDGDFPLTEHASKNVISLPMHPYLEELQQVKIINELKSII